MYTSKTAGYCDRRFYIWRGSMKKEGYKNLPNAAIAVLVALFVVTGLKSLQENNMEYVFIVTGIFLTIVLTAKVAEAYVHNKRFEAADKVRREG